MPTEEEDDDEFFSDVADLRDAMQSGSQDDADQAADVLRDKYGRR